MNNRDEINFYIDDMLLVSFHSSIVPIVDSYINIKGKTYKIIYVSHCVDHADRINEIRIRTNVELKLSKNGKLFK